MIAPRLTKTKVIYLITLLFAGILVFFLFSGEVEIKEEQDKISGAYEALNFWSVQRAYPNNSIPDVGHYAAYEFVQENFRNGLRKISATDDWTAIGPLNTGGRTNAIAFNPQNPNTIYIGSASGGLWRSYSGGVGVPAWEYIETGFPVLGVGSIAIAPNDSNTIYIATGEVYNYQDAGGGAAYRATRGTYGIGILKTTDGGFTWTKSLDWSYNQGRGVWAVKLNPLNPNTVWAATTEGTYKSNDAGQTWTQVHNVIMGTDLVINPADTNIVFVACGNFGSAGYGIYRTTDGGSTWAKLTLGLPVVYEGKAMLDIYKASPNIIFASIGNGFTVSSGASWLCKSTNNGDSWTVVSTTDYSKWQGWFSHDVAVNQFDPDIVIAVGIEIWKSTTGGSNLIQNSTGGLVLGRPPIGGPEGPPEYVHADIHDVVYHPTDSNTFYLATDGGVFRSTDGGETFEVCTGGYQTTQFYNGFSCSQQDSLFAMGGLQDNSTVIYDGDLAWIRNIGGDGSWSAINALNDNILYGSWQYLNILKSTNRGSSFSIDVTPPGDGSTSFIAPYVIGVSDPEVIYAARDKVYKSTNGGLSWTTTNNGASLDGNPVIAMDRSYQNTDVVYAGTAPFTSTPHVFRTTDGGTSWDNVTGSLPDRYPVDFAVNPNNDASVYVVFSGFGSSHLFTSIDYGTTWMDIGGGLPDVPTSAVIVDPLYPDNVYLGNDIGVFVSTDGGTTWQDFSEGLPTSVVVMDLSITNANRMLRVATHGNGVYERKLLPGVPLGIAEDELIVNDFRLEQNFPNPFNPSTTIRYDLPKTSKVVLKIYNTLGEEVITLVDEVQRAGRHSVVWDGRDNSGKNVGSGIYFYQLIDNKNSLIRKMILLH